MYTLYQDCPSRNGACTSAFVTKLSLLGVWRNASTQLGPSQDRDYPGVVLSPTTVCFAGWREAVGDNAQPQGTRRRRVEYPQLDPGACP